MLDQHSFLAPAESVVTRFVHVLRLVPLCGTQPRSITRRLVPLCGTQPRSITRGAS